MKIIQKIERKHPNWGIDNLMLHISVITGIVYAVKLFRPDIIGLLALERAHVFAFQLWRLISFIFIPPSTSIIWILFTLYFYYFIGTTLENEWGTFKFNCYYLLCMLGTIAAALIFGGTYSGLYVNLSMFLAFAYLFPNFQVMLFFVIPVKIKYLSYLNILFLAFNFFTGNLTVKLSIIASLTGFILFFGKDIFINIKAWIRRQKYKRNL